MLGKGTLETLVEILKKRKEKEKKKASIYGDKWKLKLRNIKCCS